MLEIQQRYRRRTEGNKVDIRFCKIGRAEKSRARRNKTEIINVRGEVRDETTR